MAKIYLVRHGRSEHDGRFVGVTESGLSSSGFQDIKVLQKDLSLVHFNRIYSSPQLRCLQTASVLGYSDSIEVVEGLKEIDFGKWEGLSFKQASEAYPEVFQKFSDNPLQCSFPDGDNMGDFCQRVQKTLNQLCHPMAMDENILLITHGGVLRVVFCYLLGLPAKYLNSFSPGPGRYSVVDYMPGRGVLEAFNLFNRGII